jgi:branched-chain amino acid transport system substrate-binding protein
MKLKIVLGMLAVLAAAGVQAQTIKIGELNSYKVFPAFLEPYKKGWDLALEEINKAGGVNGRKLEVISRDSSSSATRTASPGLPLSSREITSSLRPLTPPALLISSRASSQPFL